MTCRMVTLPSKSWQRLALSSVTVSMPDMSGAAASCYIRIESLPACPCYHAHTTDPPATTPTEVHDVCEIAGICFERYGVCLAPDGWQQARRLKEVPFKSSRPVALNSVMTASEVWISESLRHQSVLVGEVVCEDEERRHWWRKCALKCSMRCREPISSRSRWRAAVFDDTAVTIILLL